MTEVERVMKQRLSTRDEIDHLITVHGGTSSLDDTKPTEFEDGCRVTPAWPGVFEYDCPDVVVAR